MFNSVRRYLFAHLPRDILLELVAKLYLRLHDAKLSLLPVHSGASIGMVKGGGPGPRNPAIQCIFIQIGFLEQKNAPKSTAKNV